VSDPTETVQKALQAFDAELDRRLGTALEACLHCGRCADACVFYLSSGDTRLIPGKRLQALAKLYRSRKTPPGWLLSFLRPGSSRNLDLDALREVAYEACTMCGRCETYCTAGINTGEVMFLARSMLVFAGKTPEGLKRTLDLALDSGNSMGISKEDFIETVEWLSEELTDEYGEEMGKMPVDAQAESFYLVNPREVKFYPLSLQAAARVFNAAGESWTLSTQYFDVTNYGFFAGDSAAASELAAKAFNAAGELGCRRIVVSECGHGYNAMRYGASRWRKQRSEVEVVSIVEMMDEYLTGGRIKVDSSKNAQRITLHDPCNLVRRGGVIRPQRRILDTVASDWVEMSPRGKYNYCCGGGGGMRSQTALKKRSLQAGKLKAQQIQATGAKIVAVPCHNCIDQLEDISEEYKLRIKTTTLVELVAEALIVEGKGE
jgi:Fe-S oxidoreductase